MPQSEISNLDLKTKLTKEYLDNGGYDKIFDIGLLEDLMLVKPGLNGKVDPDTVSTRVNAFMLAILASQLRPPIYSPDHVSEYETTLQKSNSFDQQNIDTVEQFDKIYEEFKDKTDFLFRGQREAKWRLYSKLQRHWILENLDAKFESYQLLLEKLVEAGRDQYNEKYIELLGEKHDDADNDIAVLSFLQHHGCPTPLLDWTYKFQNALFFAIDGLEYRDRQKEIDDYVSVYFIKESDFAKGGDMRSLIYHGIDRSQETAVNLIIEKITADEEKRKKMREHFKGRKAIDIKRIKGSGMIAYVLKMERMINFPATYFADGKPDNITFSLNNSTNIQHQAGVFTWNADPTKPFEMVVNEQNIESYKDDHPDAHAPKQYVLCDCLNIHKKLADHIRHVLEADGIVKEFIYSTPELSTWGIYEKCKSETS